MFHTEHLAVAAYDSDMICGGMLEDMEAQAQRVAGILGVDLPWVIRVHFGTTAVDARCSERLGGCARGLGEEVQVNGDIASIQHELVHGVRLLNGVRGTQFFEEGLAEVLSGVAPYPYATAFSPVEDGPKVLATRPRGPYALEDYQVAGHFLSWLEDEYGMPAVVAFLVDDDYTSATAVEAAFERHFGLSLAEADQAWRSGSDEWYQWGEICEPSRVLSWQGEVLEWSGRLDCTNDETLGPVVTGHIATRTFCFTPAVSGVLAVELEAPGGEAFIQLAEECSTPAGLSDEHYHPKEVLAGAALELPFAACAWTVLVKREANEPMDFTLRLTRR